MRPSAPLPSPRPGSASAHASVSRARRALGAALLAAAAAGAAVLLPAAAPAALAQGIAQFEPVVDQTLIVAPRARTWVEPAPVGAAETNVVLLEGPVTITLDRTELAADNAVVWLTPLSGNLVDQRRIEVALLGNAKLAQPNGIARSAPRLFVSARVRGSVRLTAERSGGNPAEEELYRQASAIRPLPVRPGAAPSGRWVADEDNPLLPATRPATRPFDRSFRPRQTVRISADRFSTVRAPDGTLAAILTGSVTLLQRAPDGAYTELLADRAVVFTPLRDLGDAGALGGEAAAIERAVTGVYLEGDVRINRAPARARDPEQRLAANRAFYDFTTDRAVLTDVVLHTTDPNTQVPIILRARLVRQLSEGEFTAEKSVITSSSFATPSYHIGASSAYVRQAEYDDIVTGARTHFSAEDATFRVSGIPVFWLPGAAGTVTERSVLRNAAITDNNDFGFGVTTEWGLFETFGRAAPRGLDASYRLDYFSKRGFATGLDAVYAGGFISETTLQPWSFSGDVTSYLVFDHGEDRLGRERLRVDPDEDVRGRFHLRHQHLLPGDWQVQITGGYLSDPTFLEEWFTSEFHTSRPLDTSIYIKRQQDTEALWFLSSVQPNDFVTVSNLYQEQAEVERFAELGYRRTGDSILDDNLTFFSANTVSALRFDPSDESLLELGFRRSEFGPGRNSPGLPSFGQTGTPDDTNYRGDFRQELNWPFTAGAFRVVPYVVGRYTQYTESVNGDAESRLYAAAGLRLTTAFWKTDDAAHSRLFDVHRLRHVIEPQLNLYASAQTRDREDLLLYDEPVDAITDTTAVHLAINQRWQTKRGGPGRWRSVDVFRLNAHLNLFFNKPDEAELFPEEWRGLFFWSIPEASVPRDSVNLDAHWQVSDTVRAYGDLYYNLEEATVAAAGAGLSVRHGRSNYHAELRHIGLDFTRTIGADTFRFEDQDLVILGLTYDLTGKYTLSVSNAYDLAQSRNDRSLFTLIRAFDRFFVSVSFGTDKQDDETFFFLNVWPEGMPMGQGSRSLTTALGQ